MFLRRIVTEKLIPPAVKGLVGNEVKLGLDFRECHMAGNIFITITGVVNGGDVVTGKDEVNGVTATAGAKVKLLRFEVSVVLDFVNHFVVHISSRLHYKYTKTSGTTGYHGAAVAATLAPSRKGWCGTSPSEQKGYVNPRDSTCPNVLGRRI